MKRILCTIAVVVMALVVAAPLSAQETYVGTGMRLSPPWGMTMGINTDAPEPEKSNTIPYVYVDKMVCGSPADRSDDVKMYYIVYAINGHSLENVTIEEFHTITAGVTSGVLGEKVVFTMAKEVDGQRFDVELVTEELPNNFQRECK